MRVISILLHVVALFALWSALVAANIIPATGARAFTEAQYDNWTYMEGTIGDDFEGTRASIFWSWAISNTENFEATISVICTGDKTIFSIRASEVTNKGGISYGSNQFRHDETIRIRFDEDDPETFKVEIDTLDEETPDDIIRISSSDTNYIIKRMRTAEDVRFEVHDHKHRRIILSTNLKGFSEAWEENMTGADCK